MAATHETDQPNQSTGEIEFLKRLAEAGFEDVLTLKRETAEQVLTDQRMALLDTIASEDIESVRELARHVERDVSIVSRDLDVLYEADVIEYEQEGRAKRPVLAHENVLVNPVVFDGDTIVD